MGFRFAFDEKKATQATALLIEKSGGSINYMKLIKLLYLANREALFKWGKPVVPDGYYSLPYGPVLSRVLSLVNEQLRPGTVSFWNEHISAPQDYSIQTKQDPGSDEFSPREIGLIDEVFRRYGGMSEWDLVDWCHRICGSGKTQKALVSRSNPQRFLPQLDGRMRKSGRSLKRRAHTRQSGK